MGVLTGIWLRTMRSVGVKTAGLAIASITSLAAGYLWSMEFPLNKNMWTSSFVLVAGGYSLALLAFAHFTIEQMNWRKGWTWPWLVYGSNAIVAYMFSELIPGLFDTIPPDCSERQARRPVDLDRHAHGGPHSRSALAAFAYSVSFTAFASFPCGYSIARRSSSRSSMVSQKFVEEQPQIPATAGRLSTHFGAKRAKICSG